jgi:hypothetical protein
MARFALLLLAALVLTVFPVSSEAGDVFTGFQIDNHSQYFGYLGVRTPSCGLRVDQICLFRR